MTDLTIYSRAAAEKRARANAMFWRKEYAVIRLYMLNPDDLDGPTIPYFYDVEAKRVPIDYPWDEYSQPMLVSIYDANGKKRF